MEDRERKKDKGNEQMTTFFRLCFFAFNFISQPSSPL